MSDVQKYAKIILETNDPQEALRAAKLMREAAEKRPPRIKEQTKIER